MKDSMDIGLAWERGCLQSEPDEVVDAAASQRGAGRSLRRHSTSRLPWGGQSAGVARNRFTLQSNGFSLLSASSDLSKRQCGARRRRVR